MNTSRNLKLPRRKQKKNRLRKMQSGERAIMKSFNPEFKKYCVIPSTYILYISVVLSNESVILFCILPVTWCMNFCHVFCSYNF